MPPLDGHNSLQHSIASRVQSLLVPSAGALRAVHSLHGGAANRSLFVSGTEEPFGREFIRKEESARCEWTRE